MPNDQEHPAPDDERLDQAYADYLAAEEDGSFEDGPTQLGRRPEVAQVLAAHDWMDREAAALRAAMAPIHSLLSEEPSVEPGTVVGDYEVVREVGRGAGGVVYEARHVRFDQTVALKMRLSGHRASRADARRFEEEVANQALLDHPNIVPVFGGGEYDGRLYFTKKLIFGATLAEKVSGEPMSPRQAAELVALVASALHHAHQRGILHGDLHTSNVLVDTDGRPYIEDFGLSSRLDDHHVAFVAKEEADISTEADDPAPSSTTTSDVHGLGRIMYELLTGTRFYGALTADSTAPETSRGGAAIGRREADLPSSVSADLRAICLRCLEMDRERHYAFAEAVAEDIRRHLANRETTARAWGLHERLLRWRRRNRALATAYMLGAITLIAAMGMTAVVRQNRKGELLDNALGGSLAAAEGLASTAFLQLGELSDPVRMLSRDSRFAELLAEDDGDGIQAYLEEIPRDDLAPFTSTFVLNASGAMVARLRTAPPYTPAIEGLNDFTFRDYFQGAAGRVGQRGRDAVHVSRVYQGRSDGLWKLAMSAPVRNASGDFVGVVASSVRADTTMGLVESHNPLRQVALLAQKDTATLDAPGAAVRSYVVLFHPAYWPSQTTQAGFQAIDFPIPTDVSAKSFAQTSSGGDASEIWRRLRVPEYRDPAAQISSMYDGRWVAGFAPVKNTGLVVVVQQRYEDAVQLPTSVLWSSFLWNALIASLVAIVAGVIARTVGLIPKVNESA